MPKTAISFKIRKSNDRGAADYGWLKSKHTFSFANYYDPDFEDFSPLRVINEDHVAPLKGFGTHSHAEYEIFSYVVSGQLEHRDSMANQETIERGQVQFTSAGKGISHSEMNKHKSQPVHFIQIWVSPSRSRLTPSYSTGTYPDEAKLNKLCHIIKSEKLVAAATDASDKAAETLESRQTSQPIKINQDLNMFASILAQGTVLPLKLEKNRKAYIHVIEGNVALAILRPDTESPEILRGGDGVFIEVSNTAEFALECASDRNVEFLVFEMAAL